MRKQRYKISSGYLTLRIDINWDEADVDMRFAEVGRMIPFKHEVQNNVTPVGESVEKMMDAMWKEFQCDPYNKNETEWQKRGITIDEHSGLMMGNAFIMFNIDTDKTLLENLPAVRAELMKVVSKYVSTFVRYYKDKSVRSSGIGFAVV